MSVHGFFFFNFGQNQFFEFYGSEWSDTGILIAHVWSLIWRECNPKVS
jgi:hypothetical protein